MYAALKEASYLTNTSMTVITNSAVAEYLSGSEFAAQIKKARSKQDDAIRKLSGG